MPAPQLGYKSNTLDNVKYNPIQTFQLCKYQANTLFRTIKLSLYLKLVPMIYDMNKH